MKDSTCIIDNEGREAFIMPLQLTGPQIDCYCEVLEAQIARYKRIAQGYWDIVCHFTDDQGNDRPGSDTSYALERAKHADSVVDALEQALLQVSF